MKVSVIIPCYNLGIYLRDAIESVKAQSYTDYEIIVVDDGSSEMSTINAIKNLKNEYRDIKFIAQSNSGPAAARNTGINESKGKYIICLDADDLLSSDYIEKTVSELEMDKTSNIGFVTTWLKEFGERDDLWKTSEYDIPKMLAGNTVHAGSLFRKEAWEKAGGYNEKRELQGYEDWDFWLRLIEKGYRWAVVTEPLFKYRIRLNSLLITAKNDHKKKYSLLLDLHINLFMKHSRELILEVADELAGTHRAIAEKNKIIDELQSYKEEVISLREQLFTTRSELHNLKNSRVLGRVIKVRNKAGDARHLVRTLPHSTRVKVAPFIPATTRRSIKRVARKTLGRNQNVKNTILVTNREWDRRKPLVSIVIPYFNRADTIDETIASLENQTFKNFETIIVDDGSTDPDSVKKFESLATCKLKPKLIHQVNQGVAASRNNGIKSAKGKYIICLDSDDCLAPTYIEKATALLEANPNISIATTYQQIFGVTNELFKNEKYSAQRLLQGNTVITAAEFPKSAWQKVGGYKSGIGYEDWEFWVNLSEHGYWGKLIPEPLFYYRTAMQSRFVGDKEVHWTNIKGIQKLHPNYQKNVKKLQARARYIKKITKPSTALINLEQKNNYKPSKNSNKNILILVPWLTFGGAETLILNFCREVRDRFNLSIVTGLESEHEWEYKFREITENIYHLTNLFEDQRLYLEFISNYIKTRDIHVLHIIHTDWAFPLLEELKLRNPKLKVIVTLFNDRATHFEKAMAVSNYIDGYTSDNNAVYRHYLKELGRSIDARVIPNAVNSEETFNPLLFDRKKNRQELGLRDSELAVFFVGRLSEEKNPDVFLKAAEQIIHERDDTRFFVIGDGPMAGQIKKTVAGISADKVRYLGYKDEVAAYLSAGDIFVLPSSIEGFPLSILEAMAMKVAVIASDVGAVAEVIADGKDGFVVTPGDASEIASTINKLADNRKLLASIKKEARLKVESKYSNVILGENYKKLYQDFSG